MPKTFTPLTEETRTVLNTETAARHLSRQACTLRKWSQKETGPIQPVRINGRLMWKVTDLKKALQIA